MESLYNKIFTSGNKIYRISVVQENNRDKTVSIFEVQDDREPLVDRVVYQPNEKKIDDIIAEAREKIVILPTLYDAQNARDADILGMDKDEKKDTK